MVMGQTLHYPETFNSTSNFGDVFFIHSATEPL
jgi:hypothetical protein